MDLDVNMCQVANNPQFMCNGNDTDGLEQQHRINNLNGNQSNVGTGITDSPHQTALGEQAVGGSNSNPTLDKSIDVALSNSQSDLLLDQILDLLQGNKDSGKCLTKYFPWAILNLLIFEYSRNIIE